MTINLKSEWAEFKADSRAKFIILFPWFVFVVVVMLLIFSDSIFFHRFLIALLGVRLWVGGETGQ